MSGQMRSRFTVKPKAVALESRPARSGAQGASLGPASAHGPVKAGTDDVPVVLMAGLSGVIYPTFRCLGTPKLLLETVIRRQFGVRRTESAPWTARLWNPFGGCVPFIAFFLSH